MAQKREKIALANTRWCQTNHAGNPTKKGRKKSEKKKKKKKKKSLKAQKQFRSESRIGLPLSTTNHAKKKQETTRQELLLVSVSHNTTDSRLIASTKNPLCKQKKTDKQKFSPCRLSPRQCLIPSGLERLATDSHRNHRSRSDQEKAVFAMRCLTVFCLVEDGAGTDARRRAAGGV
jgi:hypothetical protein